MKVAQKCVVAALCILTLTACADAGPKQTGGQLLGGVGGALLGSQFGRGTGKLFGVAIGALAGSYLGGSIGHRLDQKDKEMAQQTMSNTLETAPDNQERGWRNPNTNHSGNFVVTKTQEIQSKNLVCRDYVHTVIIDGNQEKVHGRACRDLRDGRADWVVQN